jgi:hypothetical protein
MSRARSDQERSARIRDLCDRLLPDKTGSSLGQTLLEVLLVFA